MSQKPGLQGRLGLRFFLPLSALFFLLSLGSHGESGLGLGFGLTGAGQGATFGVFGLGFGEQLGFGLGQQSLRLVPLRSQLGKMFSSSSAHFLFNGLALA
jgi:hypothetical protein